MRSAPLPGWHPDKDKVWVVMAKARGGVAPSGERLRRLGLRMLMSLGTFKSQEQAMETASRKVASDPAFRSEYRGWVLFAAELSYCLDLHPDGKLVVRYHNETTS